MFPTNKSADEPAAAADPSSDLCLDCGLCCDGSIFSRVELEPSEYDPAARNGLEPFMEGENAYFGQPCRQFQGCCRIYPGRPLRCRDYACVLLSRVQRGEVEYGDARLTVVEARRLAAEADRTLALGETRVQSRERWEQAFAAMRAPEYAPPANPRWLLAMTAFNHYLDRHFRKPRQRRTDFEECAAPNSD